MNSIGRPRVRPRVRSVNFRSFFWLVHREACYQLMRNAHGYDWLVYNRATFARRPREVVTYHALAVLARRERRGLSAWIEPTSSDTTFKRG